VPQDFVARLIVPTLILLHRAVELDNHERLHTTEINDERSDRMLSTEVMSVPSVGAETTPQIPLCRPGVVSQFAGAENGLSWRRVLPIESRVIRHSILPIVMREK
jgi:hypothetical protein